jgi:hypothetical protein
MINCQYCGAKLPSGHTWFCNEGCENLFRDSHNELYILFNDDDWDAICPVKKFDETEEELICYNGYHEYRYDKSKIKNWKIDKCCCCEEFTDCSNLKLGYRPKMKL